MPKKKRASVTKPVTVTKPTISGWNFIRANWLVAAIVIAASLLRFWNLPAQAILVGETAQETLIAWEAVASKQLPLVGVESSLPGVFQGPLNVWLQMVGLVGSQGQLEFLFWAFAIVSVLAVVGTYELMTVTVSRRAGLIAASLVAFSPLAVAHGRMLSSAALLPAAFLLFIWMVLRLRLQQPRGIFWAVISWGILFQLELSAGLLIFLIPLVWYWVTPASATTSRRWPWLQLGSGLIVAILPHLIFELTHGFSQLHNVGIGLTARFFSSNAVPQTMTALTEFWIHGGRIWSVDYPIVTALGLILILASGAVLIGRWHRGQATLIEKSTLLSTLLLLFAGLIAGSVSDGWLAMGLISMALLLSLAWSHLLSVWQNLGILILITWAVCTALLVNHCAFFTGSVCSFSYGASLLEQRRVISFLKDKHLSSLQFSSSAVASTNQRSLDNWRLLSREAGLAEDTQAPQPVYVESKDSPLKSYPGMTRFSFTSQDIYVLH